VIKNGPCPYESLTAACLSSGIWRENALQHLDSCLRCAELVQAGEWTRGLAVDPAWPPLRDPDVLWIASRVMEEQGRRERARRSAMVFELCWVVAITGSALLLALNWRELITVFNVVAHSAAFERLSELATGVVGLTLGSLAIAAAVLVISLLIHPLLSED
jgi:hypothetical protein